MKTGRRRKKEPVPTPPEPTPVQPAGTPTPPSARPPTPTPSRPIPLWVLILVLLAILICVGIFAARACTGPGSSPITYLPATAAGSWTTTTQFLVPEIAPGEGWRTDCEADIDCTVLPGTCVQRERPDQYTEKTADEYDDYAYNIYFEETEERLYEASGTTFVTTQLNPPTSWQEGDLSYYSEEWLDKDTCQYTNFTVWITDPQDTSYDIEVLLSECEVWDHVVVKERVYEVEEYCRTETIASLGVQDTETLQGVGAGIEWTQAAAAAGGRLERSFEGSVTFRADGTTHTVRVTDPDRYIRYLTVPFYLAVDEEGNVVDLSETAP